MIGAHGATGGFNMESLFLAVPLIVLGVALFLQKSSPPAVPLALVGIGLLFAVGSFSFLGGADTGEYGEMLHSLCDASDLAEQDREAATTAFNDEVHGPLHGFADDVAQEDRAAAGAVLEAKQRVEAIVEVRGDPGPALSELTDAVEGAMAAVGEDGLTCDDF